MLTDHRKSISLYRICFKMLRSLLQIIIRAMLINVVFLTFFPRLFIKIKLSYCVSILYFITSLHCIHLIVIKSALLKCYPCIIAPPFWSCLADYEMCAGTMQSPVNIETHHVVKNNKIGKFYFSGLRKTAGMKMELKNYGHGGIWI